MMLSSFNRTIMCCVVFINTTLLAFNKDSLIIKNIKTPKHYFKTTTYFDFYGTSSRDLATKSYVSKKLKTYKVTQFAIGFNTPLFTKDDYKKDSITISNFHLLLTGNYSVVSPIFSGISNHNLSKSSLGLRLLYNTGKKSVFFGDISPFLTQDNGYNYTQRIRTAFSFIYNCTINDKLSLRLGLTRSYMFGNRFTLPYLGLRIGRMDRVNFNIQFPRSISFNFPIGNYIKTSIYTKPQGGIYSLANSDSLYNLNNDKTINFGRYEFLMGTRFDINPNKNIGFYLGGGISTQNAIAMYSETFNNKNKGRLGHFYSEKISGALFINLGITVKFGKTKSIYNNYAIYDAIDLNNSEVGGDNNINSGSSEIPKMKRKLNTVKPNEMEDLIETQDLY